MIESITTYDLLPGIDEKAYNEWSKKAVGTILKGSGVVELRAGRNTLGTPQIKVATVFKSYADWAKALETWWPPLEAELRKFSTNLRVEIWGPSPNVPDVLRPAK